MNKNKLVTSWIAALLIVEVSAVSMAVAANPHYVTGPTITTSATGVTACGKIAGLGNIQTVTVVVDASVTQTCTNRGQHIPSGLTQEVSGEGDFRADKNGTVTFCVTTETPENTCPDDMRARNTFSNISVSVFDSRGRQIL